MVARPAPAPQPSADGVEFVRFCYQRRKVGWPELYDEMCGVAGRGLFRGWGPDDLAANGISFTLGQMPALATLVTEIVAADRAEARARSVATTRSSVTPASVG